MQSDQSHGSFLGGVVNTAISAPSWIIATAPWTLDDTVKVIGILTGLLAAAWWGLSIYSKWRKIRRGGK